jgi:hypothetical protein
LVRFGIPVWIAKCIEEELMARLTHGLFRNAAGELVKFMIGRTANDFSGECLNLLQ